MKEQQIKLQEEDHPSLNQIIEKGFIRPITKLIIPKLVTSIDQFSDQKQQKQVLQKGPQKTNSQFQKEYAILDNQEIPSHSLLNLIDKMKIALPEFQAYINHQKQTVKDIEQDIQDLKKQVEIENKLTELEHEAEQPACQGQKKEKVQKIKAIHKSLRIDFKKWQQNHREKQKRKKQLRNKAFQQKMEHLRKMAQKQQSLQMLQEQVSQKIHIIQQHENKIKDYAKKQQWIRLQMQNKNRKIRQMGKNQKEKQQKIGKLQNGKTKFISKVKKGITMINLRYKANYFYEKSLIQLLKDNLKIINQSKPESQRQNLEEIDKIISSKILVKLRQTLINECHQKWQEPERTKKIELVQPIVNSVKNFIYQKNMILFRDNKLTLKTKISKQEELDACEFGFQLNRIPYDERIDPQELKKLDWTGVNKIHDTNVDEKRWRFLVDNFGELFKDLKWVSLKNVISDEIKLQDLEKMFSLERLHFTLDENSSLKRQLKNLIWANKQLQKFVYIS